MGGSTSSENHQKPPPDNKSTEPPLDGHAGFGHLVPKNFHPTGSNHDTLQKKSRNCQREKSRCFVSQTLEKSSVLKKSNDSSKIYPKLSFMSLILLHPYIFRWNCSSSFRLLISVWRGQVSSETKWNWRYVAFDAHAAPEYIATNSVSSQNLGWHRANREVLGPFHTSSDGWDSWRSCSWWWSNSVRSSWATTANQLIDLIPYCLQMGFSLTFMCSLVYIY